jgi:hypothetical protein
LQGGVDFAEWNLEVYYPVNSYSNTKLELDEDIFPKELVTRICDRMKEQIIENFATRFCPVISNVAINFEYYKQNMKMRKVNVVIHLNNEILSEIGYTKDDKIPISKLKGRLFPTVLTKSARR